MIVSPNETAVDLPRKCPIQRVGPLSRWSSTHLAVKGTTGRVRLICDIAARAQHSHHRLACRSLPATASRCKDSAQRTATRVRHSPSGRRRTIATTLSRTIKSWASQFSPSANQKQSEGSGRSGMALRYDSVVARVEALLMATKWGFPFFTGPGLPAGVRDALAATRPAPRAGCPRASPSALQP